MAVDYIRRGSTTTPGRQNRANVNFIYVDSDIDQLKFGAAATGTTEKTAVDLSSTQTITGAKTFDNITLPTNLRTGFIPLDLGGARIIGSNVFANTTEGLLLDGNTDPILQRINGATDKGVRIAWAASSAIEIQLPGFAYPPDLDDTANVEVHFLANMAGAVDTPVVAVAYFEGIGDTNAGGNSAAVTGVTLTEYSVVVTAANIGPQPSFANISLIPAAHTTDILYLYAAWIEYTRKTA